MRCESATLTIDGYDLDMTVKDFPWPSCVDMAEPGADRSVTTTFFGSAVLEVRESVPGDFKRFVDAVLAGDEERSQFDPWADTRRLNEQGRSENPERDANEVILRRAMRGSPLVVTTAQGKHLEAIEFDKSLYVATDHPFGVPLVEPCAISDQSWMRSLDDYNQEKARERAERSDPFHPSRRTKGEKHRNRRARK